MEEPVRLPRAEIALEFERENVQWMLIWILFEFSRRNERCIGNFETLNDMTAQIQQKR